MANASAFDALLVKCESALVRVEASQGSMVKLMKAETDLLTNIEALRTMLTAALSDGDKDRVKLIEVFGGNCERISRARGMLEAVTLSPRNAADQRPAQALTKCETIERILIEKGLSHKLAEAQQKNAWAARKASVIIPGSDIVGAGFAEHAGAGAMGNADSATVGKGVAGYAGASLMMSVETAEVGKGVAGYAGAPAMTTVESAEVGKGVAGYAGAADTTTADSVVVGNGIHGRTSATDANPDSMVSVSGTTQHAGGAALKAGSGPSPTEGKQREEPSLTGPTRKVITTSNAGTFEPDDVPRQVTVGLSCLPLDPDLDFGENGTYVMKIPSLTGVLETTVTPALPVREGISPVEPRLEFPVPMPDAASTVIFDPDAQAPAGGKWSMTFECKMKVLEMPNTIEAKVGCQSLSPWGSQQFQDFRGETELHWDVTIQGRFAMSEGKNSTILEVELVFHLQGQLSGAASAKYSSDGQPLPPPDRGQ